MIDYLAAVAVESVQFRRVVRAGDLAGRVPACQDWNLADLVWHLTEVQDFWGDIVGGLLTDPDDVVQVERPADYELVALFEDRSARLVRVLGERSPDDECWSWHDSGHSVGWVRRRQAHEALIHRVDAEQSAGLAVTLDPVLADDGVDEMLASLIDGPVPEWGVVELDGLTATLRASDARREWGIAFGRFRGTSPVSDRVYDLDTLHVTDTLDQPDVTISADAAELDLWLWGRVDAAGLSIEGDESLADRLRAIAADAAQ